MQTNLFTKEQINKESSIGEFFKGEAQSENLSKLYFNYPGVKGLYLRVQEALNKNQKVIFKTKKAIENSNLQSDDFLKDNAIRKRNHADGCMTSIFGALLTANISGQKVLGNYSIATIEAQACKIFHDHFHPNKAIDHFYPAQGLCNLELFTETIKSFEIKKNEVIALLLPSNAIKAFKENKFSSWQSLESQTRTEDCLEVFLQDKKDEKTKATIKLVSEEIKNLQAPIYKVKADDRWVMVVPSHHYLSNEKTNLGDKVELSISNSLIKNLKSNKKYDENDHEGCLELEASLGQAARVIFELLDGDYDCLPEAMLNFEGGSWSSIALESSSSGRHMGVNSMHEVLFNKWYEHNEIAIPWNYLGFDKLSYNNLDLIEDANVYVLSLEDNDKKLLEKNCFIEANQSWKKIINEIIKYSIKFVYREYSAIASKKYLLSTKEIMQIAAKFLAQWSINNFSIEKYQDQIKDQVSKELVELLECVAYSHMMLKADADFHSTKSHSKNIERLKYLGIIQKKLEKLCPISVKNFKHKVFNLLQKDIKTENTTLWNLYQQVLVSQ